MSWTARENCEGKERFPSYTAALRVYERMLRTHEDQHLHIYHCIHCNGCHIGEALAGRRYGRRPVRRSIQLTRADLYASAGL